jgi:murein DD-endopeptidase MepM/ murein hydrolase activator NlpD
LAVAFAGNYSRLQSQLEELQREREMGVSRQKEMRTTILSQQDEVRNLSTEVKQLEADLIEIERISKEIRELIGVEEPDLTSTPEPSSLRVDEPFGLGGGSPYQFPSNYSMAVVGETSQHVQDIGPLLPVTLQKQQILWEQVSKRLQTIEPIKRHDPETLEAELRLLAAAPKRWPVDGEFRITSGYGPREFKGKPEFHTGIDIGVWYSTEVKATKAGKVVFAGSLPRYGWTVEIEHEMGYSTIYAHNRYYFPDTGDKVEEGEVIALSGDSGDTTGPHLHYEIRLSGKPVDPMKYLDLGE